MGFKRRPTNGWASGRYNAIVLSRAIEIVMRETGLSLEDIAYLTGTTVSSIYKYGNKNRAGGCHILIFEAMMYRLADVRRIGMEIEAQPTLDRLDSPVFLTA